MLENLSYILLTGHFTCLLIEQLAVTWIKWHVCLWKVQVLAGECETLFASFGNSWHHQALVCMLMKNGTSGILLDFRDFRIISGGFLVFCEMDYVV